MPFPRGREPVLAIAIVALAACAPGDADPVGTGSTPLVGEPVDAAAIEPLAVAGDGRALAAQFADDRTMVVVTTEGVYVERPDSGAATAVVSFDPAGEPDRAVVSPAGDEVAVLDPRELRVYSTATGSVTRMWPVSLGVGIEELWFEPAAGTLVVTTSSGPVLIGADGSIVLDATVDPLPTGRLDSLPDGTVVGAIRGANDLLVVRPTGEVERRPIATTEGERLGDVSVAPSGGIIGVSVSPPQSGSESGDRVVLLDAGFVEIGAIDTASRLDASNWVLVDDGLTVAAGTALVSRSIDGSERGRIEMAAPVVRMYAVGDGTVVVGQDGSVARWGGGVSSASIAPASVSTVYEGVDLTSGSVTIVDRFGLVVLRGADGRVLRSEDAYAIGEPTALAVASDGSAIAVGSTVGIVSLLGTDLRVQGELQAAPYGVRVGAVVFDPRGPNLVTGVGSRRVDGTFDDTVTMWSIDLDERFRALGDPTDVSTSSFFDARVRFGPDGSILVAASSDFDAVVLDPATGAVLDELPGSARIVDLAFSPDGSVLVVAHDDGVIDVWDAAERSLLAAYRPQRPGVTAISVLPDSDAMVIADVTGRLSVIDVMTGETFLVLEDVVARTGPLVTSPDGALAAAARADGTVGLWSTDSGALLAGSVGHAGAITALAFSPDGSRLYSASEDGTVRSWSVVTGP